MFPVQVECQISCEVQGLNYCLLQRFDCLMSVFNKDVINSNNSVLSAKVLCVCPLLWFKWRSEHIFQKIEAAHIIFLVTAERFSLDVALF